MASPPTPEPHPEPHPEPPVDHAAATPAYRLAALFLGLAAGAMLLVGGGLPAWRAENAEPPPPPAHPRPIEPEGEYETPPTLFRWETGGDVDFAQLLVFRDDFSRVWASGPLDTTAVEIPPDAYREMHAGVPCYWMVREARNGSPRAGSRLVEFWFQKDLEGFGPGENTEISPYIVD